jgi:kumamolisin
MMTRLTGTAAALTVSLLACSALMSAQSPTSSPAAPVVPIFPASSVANDGDRGMRAHTNLEILRPTESLKGEPQVYGPPLSGLLYHTPASLGCIYKLQPAVAGCNPNTAYMNPQGGRRAIALVDAYDNPNAYADLQAFSAQFGLAAINPTSFRVVFAPAGGDAVGSCSGSATRPPSAKGTGWDLEEALDIEYAHAMAPLATLYLVEAQSNTLEDLNCAVSVASQLVKAAGGGQVSMSWGSSEFEEELTIDPLFTTPGVVYFASSGDGPGVSYPAASPNVVSVGGTTLIYDVATGTFKRETTWQETGGGISAFEPRPVYQDGIAVVVGSQRGTPDVSANANPYTGVWVLNSLTLGAPAWYIVGGTSLSAPLWAGIVNSAGKFSASSAEELARIYAAPDKNFNDITGGVCGPYMGSSATKDWDECSGVGSPKKYAGK